MAAFDDFDVIAEKRGQGDAGDAAAKNADGTVGHKGGVLYRARPEAWVASGSTDSIETTFLRRASLLRSFDFSFAAQVTRGQRRFVGE